MTQSFFFFLIFFLCYFWILVEFFSFFFLFGFNLISHFFKTLFHTFQSTAIICVWNTIFGRCSKCNHSRLSTNSSNTIVSCCSNSCCHKSILRISGKSNLLTLINNFVLTIVFICRMLSLLQQPLLTKVNVNILDLKPIHIQELQVK